MAQFFSVYCQFVVLPDSLSVPFRCVLTFSRLATIRVSMPSQVTDKSRPGNQRYQYAFEKYCSFDGSGHGVVSKTGSFSPASSPSY